MVSTTRVRLSELRLGGLLRVPLKIGRVRSNLLLLFRIELLRRFFICGGILLLLLLMQYVWCSVIRSSLLFLHIIYLRKLHLGFLLIKSRIR